jgi:hypothetical protein
MVWKCPPLHLLNWNNLWKWKEDMRDGGKGDAPRPLGVSMEQFDANFDAIFGKKKKYTMEEIDQGVYLIEVTNERCVNYEEQCNFKCADVGCGSDKCSGNDCGR